MKSYSGSGPVLLSDLGCYGNENDLFFCNNTGWDNNSCSHDNDIFVSCGKQLLVHMTRYDIMVCCLNHCFVFDYNKMVESRVLWGHNTPVKF